MLTATRLVFVAATAPFVLTIGCSVVPAGTAALPQETAAVGTSGGGQAWSDRLTEPVSALVTFESPAVHTSVRPFFIYHKFPKTPVSPSNVRGIFDGGDAQVYGVQVRYAVTEKLAVMATKSGWIHLDPGSDSPLGREGGWADLAAGAKYAVYEDPDLGLLVTPGLTFEADSGNHDVFQGNGDGMFHPFVSAGLDLGELDLVGSLGYNQPVDNGEESSSLDYHLHLSYEIAERFFPLIEVNGISYTSDGNFSTVNFEGTDLINLGSNDVDGNTVITGAVGGRVELMKDVLFGTAYEFPLTSRRDLFGWRITADVMFIF